MPQNKPKVPLYLPIKKFSKLVLGKRKRRRWKRRKVIIKGYALITMQSVTSKCNNFFQARRSEEAGVHRSIPLTRMLVLAQISTTQK